MFLNHLESDYNNIGLAHVISTKIKISNLYKIFGSNSKKYIPEVRDGMSKDELLSILSEGKVAIIYDDETFIGFVTKVDLINYYRNRFK